MFPGVDTVNNEIGQSGKRSGVDVLDPFDMFDEVLDRVGYLAGALREDPLRTKSLRRVVTAGV